MIFARRALKLLTPKGEVKIDAARCVRTRFASSGCSACATACPEHAITFGSEPMLDASSCTSCRRCEAACPTGAIVSDSQPITALAAELAKQAQPVLGCRVDGVRATVRTGCLGFLGVEDVVGLQLAVPQGVTLNLSRCGQCRNAFIVDPLREVVGRAEAITADLAPGRVDLCFDDAGIVVPDVSLSRRGFFAAFGKECAGAAASLAPELSDAARRAPEGPTKSVPAHRRLLLRELQELATPRRAAWESAHVPRLDFGSACNNCCGCDGICPTGAISTSASDPPRPIFHAALCTGCAVCQEFCPERAIALLPSAPATGITGQPEESVQTA